MTVKEPSPAIRALAALLVRLHPADVRSRFGDELRAAFEQAWIEEQHGRHPAGRLLVLARLTIDAVTSAAAFRLRLHPSIRYHAVPEPRRRPMSGFTYDLKLAVRALLKARTFTVTAALILALGIAAVTSVSALVYEVLLRPLPYPDPERLVMIWDVRRDTPGEHQVASPGNINDWRQQSRAFDAIAVFNLASATFDGPGGRERVPGAQVTANYFDVLGVRPHLGRALPASGEQAGGAPAIVLSHGFWLRRFGGNPSIVGRTTRVGTFEIVVAGVMPPGFQGPEERYFGRTDFWVPMRIRFEGAGRGGHYLRTVARLKDGVTLEQAQDDIRRIADHASAEYPETNRRWTAAVVPLQEELVAGVRPILLMLLAAVALVHLTVCANLTNLLLSRAIGRQREYAIRAAIGATRRRIVQSFILESGMLAAAGGVAGLLMAAWMTRAIALLVPDLPRVETIGLGTPAAGAALAVAVVSAVLFGGLPAFGAAGYEPWRALQTSARAVGGRGRTRVRRALVAAEIAVSVTLLVCAALLAQSFLRLAAEPSGFSSAGVLTARVGLPNASEAPAQGQSAERVIAEIRALPGVQEAGFTTSLPFAGLNNLGLNVQTRTPEGDREMQMRYRAVTPGYLRAMRIELKSGRLLDDRDRSGAAGAVLVNESAAAAYGGRGPIGSTVAFDFGGQTFQGAIVGVVAGVRHDDLGVAPEPEMFVPYAQHPVMSPLFLAARADGPLPSAAMVGAAVRREQPLATVEDVVPLTDLVGRSLATQRMNAVLLLGLAAITVVLAIVGLYAVIAQGVAQRVREIGIRLALGADRSQIRRLVLSDGLALGLIGLGLGMVAARLAGGALERLLYRTEPDDSGTYIAVTLLMTAVALMASYLPARKASRVDPMISLRNE